MARRAASIWRAVIQPGSRAWRPHSPKLTSAPRRALPFMRPRICLRHLTRFGINIATTSFHGLWRAILLANVNAFSRLSFFFHFGLHIALVDPHLDANPAIGGQRFR